MEVLYDVCYGSTITIDQRVCYQILCYCIEVLSSLASVGKDGIGWNLKNLGLPFTSWSGILKNAENSLWFAVLGKIH